MLLTQFRVDDEPHAMDGLRLLAQDGAEGIEAFIGRKVMDVWPESIEHRGGRQSLFRDQYNALGNWTLRHFGGLWARNKSEALNSTANIPSSRFYSLTLRKAARPWI